MKSRKKSIMLPDYQFISSLLNLIFDLFSNMKTVDIYATNNRIEYFVYSLFSFQLFYQSKKLLFLSFHFTLDTIFFHLSFHFKRIFINLSLPLNFFGFLFHLNLNRTKIIVITNPSVKLSTISKK